MKVPYTYNFANIQPENLKKKKCPSLSDSEPMTGITIRELFVGVLAMKTCIVKVI